MLSDGETPVLIKMDLKSLLNCSFMHFCCHFNYSVEDAASREMHQFLFMLFFKLCFGSPQPKMKMITNVVITDASILDALRRLEEKLPQSSRFNFRHVCVSTRAG